MGQIDFDKIKGNTGNQAKSGELANSEPTNAGQPPVELTDSTSENTEDTNEAEKKTQDEQHKEGGAVVVVTYVGTSIWKDGEGKLWAANKMTDNIMSERQYPKDVYDAREDLKFMVKYGTMKISVVEK